MYKQPSCLFSVTERKSGELSKLGQTITSFGWDEVEEEPQEIQQVVTAVRHRKMNADLLGASSKQDTNSEGGDPEVGLALGFLSLACGILRWGPVVTFLK
jgi:hypothetical protein